MIRKDRFLRMLIYAFIILILYDGVLRKWVLPSLSSEIMILKVGIAILITICGFKYWKKFGFWEISFALIGVIVFFTTLIWGHGDVLVDLWGCIPYWFCMTTCVIMSKVLEEQDIIKIGKGIVYTSMLNSILVIAQFFVLPSHILNFTGSEVDERMANIPVYMLAGAFRPSGLFIYNTGNSWFTMLAIGMILYFMFVRQKEMKRIFVITALMLSVGCVLCSASRTLLFYASFMACYFVVLFIHKKDYKKIFIGFLVSVPIILYLSTTHYGELAINNMTSRLEEASEVQYSGKSTWEGTIQDIIDRNITYNIEAIFDPRTLDGEIPPEIGYGQGMSTQIGGRLLNINKNSGFALAEWDGLRIVCESGVALGLIIIFLRLGYFLRFIKNITRRNSNILSMMLFPPFAVSFYLITTWGNAFLLCFAMMCGGLYMAAKKYDSFSKH